MAEIFACTILFNFMIQIKLSASLFFSNWILYFMLTLKNKCLRIIRWKKKKNRYEKQFNKLFDQSNSSIIFVKNNFYSQLNCTFNKHYLLLKSKLFNYCSLIMTSFFTFILKKFSQQLSDFIYNTLPEKRDK